MNVLQIRVLVPTSIEILADVRVIIEKKDVRDEETAAFLLQTKEKVEPDRQEAMRQAFQRTILAMIPSSLLCCMAINAAEAQSSGLCSFSPIFLATGT